MDNVEVANCKKFSELSMTNCDISIENKAQIEAQRSILCLCQCSLSLDANFYASAYGPYAYLCRYSFKPGLMLLYLIIGVLVVE